MGFFDVQFLPAQLPHGEGFRQVVVPVFHGQVEPHLALHAEKLDLQIRQRVIICWDVEHRVKLAAFQLGGEAEGERLAEAFERHALRSQQQAALRHGQRIHTPTRSSWLRW